MLHRPHSTTIYRSHSFDSNKARRINSGGVSSINRSSKSSNGNNTNKAKAKAEVSSSDSATDDSDWNNSDEEKKAATNKTPRNEAAVEKKSNIIWLPGSKKVPALILFSPEVVLRTLHDLKKIGDQYHLTYKFQGGEKRLIKAILDGHGFKEVHPHNGEFNVLWTGNNLKTYIFRTLKEYQKVNHFPRSCELTRKDRLYKNVQKMQQEKGIKTFQLCPLTFVLPFEYAEFYTTFYREKGVWIVKPVALSRGRGIYLINHPDQVPLDENLVVSKYITNPLLIEGFKFDVRLYVAVTSFDPLVFYLYEEGLTRFATCKYDKSQKNMKNTWMHLTNYSVNKKNKKYVRCDDPDVEDYGNKWSMSAMLRYLAREGKDTFAMMMQIEELIIKTLLAVESPLASAARMFIPHRGNCFEVFGFDILVDEELKPWVLEVNLSPSLDCDAVLDLRIKSHMVSDLFTLTGVHCQDPAIYSNRSRFNQRNDSRQSSTRSRPHSANLLTSTLGNTDPGSAPPRPHLDSRPSTSKTQRASSLARTKSEYSAFEGLSQNEASIFKSIQEENNRRGGWIRLFPTSDTWEFYSQYLEVRTTSYNLMMHQKLFPKRWLNGGAKRTSISRAKILQSSYTIYKQTSNQNLLNNDTGACLDDAIKRYKVYERKLGENINSSAFENALKRFAPPAESTGNQQNNKTLDSETDSVEMTSSKPPISASSSSSIGKVSTVAAKHVLDGSKKSLLYHDEKQQQQPEYDLNAIIRHLDDGYYMSRTQVRYAFTLYLSKIQLRLVIESEVKDESNIQQMELVLRFMKKAAGNLTQQFKVYVPSKRLPIYEQKRMLAKELQDFLHIYKKDTELLKVDASYDIEAQRQKNKKSSFNEILLIHFLNKCSEMQLEEIMSAYMKTSKDSSAFLGTAAKKQQPQDSPIDHVNNRKSAKGRIVDASEQATPKPAPRSTMVTSVGVKSNNKKQIAAAADEDNNNNDDIIDDANSSLLSSNSSLSSSSRKPHQQQARNGHRVAEVKRTKSAAERRANGAAITKEKLTNDETEKIYQKSESYRTISQNAAAMTSNLQNTAGSRSLSSMQQNRQKPKSATGPRRPVSTTLHTADNQQTTPKAAATPLEPIESKPRPFSAAVYVHKHKHEPPSASSSADEDDDGLASNKANDWSSRLRSLTQKQQVRQYSTSVAAKSLLVDLNNNNNNGKENQNGENNFIIKKQKEILEQSKKALQLHQKSAYPMETQVSIDENRLRQSKMLGTLERYSPLDFNLPRQTKPPPAPLLTTANSYKFKN